MASLPERVRLFLGDMLGVLWFDVFRIRRNVAIENTRKAFPEWSESRRNQAVRNSLRGMGRSLVEFCLFPFFTREKLDRKIEYRGLNNIDDALKLGKGVLFLSLHVGNGDIIVAGLSSRGYPMNVISKLFKNKALNDIWFGMRSKLGTKFISPEKSSFDILKALKRKEIVVFVLDQFMGPPIGVRTKFFGHETGTAMGLAVIADRTKAPVVPAYTFRKPDGTHIAVFEPALRLDESLMEENIARMTQAYTDKIEQIIRQDPDQWMWIHRRWKEFRD